MISLSICALLYVAVCLVITGLVHYSNIDVNAPLASAVRGVGLNWVETVIALGGVVGLATTLLIGLFAQARVYLSVARDNLIPAPLAAVHPKFKTPYIAQAFCGLLAMTLALLFNVRLLAEILDIVSDIMWGITWHVRQALQQRWRCVYKAMPYPVLRLFSVTSSCQFAYYQGVIVGYGSVCASVLVQRSERREHTVRWILILIFAAAVPFSCTQFHVPPLIWGLLLLLPLCALMPLIRRQHYPAPAGAFHCPGVPWIPLAGIILNVYLASHLHRIAWLRLAVLWVVLTICYVLKEVKRQKGGFSSIRECLSGVQHEEVIVGGREECRRRKPIHASSASDPGNGLQRPMLAPEDRV